MNPAPSHTALPALQTSSVASPLVHNAQFFDDMFDSGSDPWKYQFSWYEARTRAMVMAALPNSRYAHAFEPGCSQGELILDLALRCDQLLACDGAARAVEVCTARTRHLPQVQVVQAWLPGQWPVGQFDLRVLSEWLYYLDVSRLAAVAQAARSSLRPGGTVLACHWRWPIKGVSLSGDQAVNAGTVTGLTFCELTCGVCCA